jgi:hypothetical protein
VINVDTLGVASVFLLGSPRVLLQVMVEHFLQRRRPLDDRLLLKPTIGQKKHCRVRIRRQNEFSTVKVMEILFQARDGSPSFLGVFGLQRDEEPFSAVAENDAVPA